MPFKMESPARPTAGLPVYVSVRICPVGKYDSGQICFNTPDDGVLQIGYGNYMNFHHTFSQSCSQENLFKTSVEPLSSSFIEGYNGTVITFGPNNSGKTFTMNGPGLYCAMNECEFGLLPRAVRHIFAKLNKFDDLQYTIEASYLEFFGNQIYDLLNPENNEVITLQRYNNNLAIQGATNIQCETIENVFSCLETGLTSRQFRMPSCLNDNMSSTSVFFLTLHQWKIEGESELHKYSQLCFIDLGCSDLGYFRDFIEDNCYANSINTLHGLSGFKASSTNTRESILGTILKESFGGNTVTVSICCIEGTSNNITSSIFSLHIASLAQNLSSYPLINNEPSHILLIDPRDSNILQFQDHTSEIHKFSEVNEEQLFKLKFATVQYQSLVKQAESILNEMTESCEVKSDTLSAIQQWLCMKQECEDCVDECDNKNGNNNEELALRRLDVIEEVTEPSSSIVEDNVDLNILIMENKERLQVVVDSLVQDIETTDLSDIINIVTDINERTSTQLKTTLLESDSESSSCHSASAISDETKLNLNLDTKKYDYVNKSSGLVGSGIPYDRLRNRRNSILPQTNNIVLSNSVKSEDLIHHAVENHSSDIPTVINDSPIVMSVSSVSSSKKDVGTNTNLEVTNFNNKQYGTAEENFKQLLNNADSIRLQIKRLTADISCSEKKLNELESTIDLKEGLINDLKKCAETNDITKEKIEKKISRLKLEIHYAKANCKELQEAIVAYQQYPDKQKYLQNKLLQYGDKYDNCKKRLDDLLQVESMPQESEKKIEELEKSLSTMKEEQKSLIKYIEEEKINMSRMKDNLQQCENEIKEYEKMSVSKCSSNKESLRTNSAASTKSKKEMIIDEDIRKSKIDVCHEKNAIVHDKTQCIEKNERIVEMKLQKNPKVKNGIDTLQEGINEDSKIRQEIKKLRKTRDNLISDRQILDHKLYKKRGLSQQEERRLLELDEAIEAIDTSIEYKNEIICNHQQELACPDDSGLIGRLMNLTISELQSLLYKYFYKVVDLREESRKLEIQCNDLENQVEDQSTYIQDLSAALHRTTLESERKLVTLQREYEEKMAILLRQINEDSYSIGNRNERKTRELEKDLAHYKKTSREYKKRLRDMLEGNMSFTPEDHAALLCPSPNPHKSKPYAPTTKITRERNKIIIQQQRRDQRR